jgi:hypothetical protein
METAVIFPVPLELAVVNRVVQDFRDGAAGDCFSISAGE